MSAEQSERTTLFLYIADNVSSPNQLPLQMRIKINAVRAVRGEIEKNLEEKAHTASVIYNLVAVNPKNPNLAWMKRDVEETAARLEEYKKSAANNRQWLKSADPELYAAAETQTRKQIACACSDSQVDEDNVVWINPKAPADADDNEPTPDQKFKRTRV